MLKRARHQRYSVKRTNIQASERNWPGSDVGNHHVFALGEKEWDMVGAVATRGHAERIARGYAQEGHKVWIRKTR